MDNCKEKIDLGRYWDLKELTLLCLIKIICFMHLLSPGINAINSAKNK